MIWRKDLRRTCTVSSACPGLSAMIRRPPRSHGLSTSTSGMRPSWRTIDGPVALDRRSRADQQDRERDRAAELRSREIRGAGGVAAGDPQVRLVDLVARAVRGEQGDDEDDRPRAEDRRRPARGDAPQPPHAIRASAVTPLLIPGVERARATSGRPVRHAARAARSRRRRARARGRGACQAGRSCRRPTDARRRSTGGPGARTAP